MQITSKTIRWLLQGDPSICWQVLRDLCDEPASVYASERSRVASEGWGARLLAKQDEDGNWGRGIYSPKWKSTTYTLLHLRQLGLPPEHLQALRGCEKFFSRGLERDGGINLWRSHHHSETCINGMFLALLAYFGYPDERIHSIADFLLGEQMPDGGWNCERIKGATHASFHTTISVLEGLDEYGTRYPENLSAVMEARVKAHEFLLQHRLYQSHRTGEPAELKMTLMHFPPRWHYDFLRGLDYFQNIDAPKDQRMNDAIQLLRAKQNSDETWLLNAPWPGLVYFHMEATSQPSRWNTLRALRVLKWWQS